ncbi:hypothetical protein AB4Y36_10205 [Paraburkholderia sp. BR10936]|uniref:hypothetical protein n=1 Tax=Paraburkholderia sp. BR10936 TaxID=3236993 RepID=UPI0034D1B2D1
MTVGDIEVARKALVVAVRTFAGNDQYSDYIRRELAGDFAVTVASLLAERTRIADACICAAIEPPYNAEQAKAWLEVVKALREFVPEWSSVGAPGATPAQNAVNAIRTLAEVAREAVKGGSKTTRIEAMQGESLALEALAGVSITINGNVTITGNLE